MKTQTKPETLENYLSLTYPITLYPEPDGGYTVMMTDLVGCISQGVTIDSETLPDWVGMF